MPLPLSLTTPLFKKGKPCLTAFLSGSLLWLFLQLLLPQTISAGDSTNKLPVQGQSTPPAPSDIRQFDPQQLNDYRNNPNYQYQPKPYKPTWFTRFMNWLLNLFDSVFSQKGSNRFFNLVKQLLVLALVIIIASAILNVKITELFFKKPKSNYNPAHDFLNENIHELNFDQLIAEASAGQNYRKAIRLLYLKTLKQLTDQNLIDWQPNKTNRDYLAELQLSTFYPPFEQATFVFNYVWYGNFNINPHDYGVISTQFNRFHDLLNKKTVT